MDMIAANRIIYLVIGVPMMANHAPMIANTRVNVRHHVISLVLAKIFSCNSLNVIIQFLILLIMELDETIRSDWEIAETLYVLHRKRKTLWSLVNF